MTFLNFSLFIILLIINYLVYKSKKYSKTFFIITNVILIINFILIFLLYYNNISLGFKTGIAVGDLNGIYLDDEFKYFWESDLLSKALPTYGFSSWFARTLPSSMLPTEILTGPYGFYNPFIFILSLVRLLGFNNLNDILIIKLIFVLINCYFLYEISTVFCNKKYIYAPLILFNLSPPYILINITLSRDLIIISSILYIFKFIILRQKNYIHILIPILLLLIFRSYVILSFIATILLLIRNTNKLFSKYDLTYILLILAGVFILLNINIPISKVEFLKNSLKNMYGDSLYTPIDLTISTLWDIFIKSPYLRLLKTNSIYCILTSLSSLYYMVIGLFFTIRVLIFAISKKKTEHIYLIKFVLYFTLFNAYILMMRDGFITSRITNMWLFMFVIVIFIPFEGFSLNYLNTKKTDS